MADLDTRSKRASSAGILLAFALHPVLPDATIGQGDRQHIAQTYSGIAASVVLIPDTLEDLTTLWTQAYQPAIHAALAVGASYDDTTLVDYDIQTNGLGYDGEQDLNTALAKYIDTVF